MYVSHLEYITSGIKFSWEKSPQSEVNYELLFTTSGGNSPMFGDFSLGER